MRIPIQPYQRQVEPSLPGAPVLQSETPANPLAQFGDALQHFAVQHEENAQRWQHEQDKAWVFDQSPTDRLKWTQQQQKLEQAADPAATDYTPQVMKSFDAYQEEALKAAPSPNARRMYQQQLGALREHVALTSLAFEQKQRSAYRTDVLTDSANKLATTASIDPSQFPVLMAQQAQAVGNTDTLDADQKTKLLRQSRDLMSYAAARTLVERDPRGWLTSTSNVDLANAHPVIPSLRADHLAILNDHAAALVAHQDAATQREQDKRLKEAGDSFKELMQFSVSGELPSLDYTSEVLAKTTGTPYEGMSRTVLEQARAGSAFGARTLPEQQQIIRQMDAQRAGQGTSPEGDALYKRALGVHETQVQAYKENPWAAGARFARLPSVPDQPLAGIEALPSYIAQTAPLMSAVETAAGGPVSPLQPRQAAKLTEQLKGMPVADRADVLARTGAMLSADRIGALAEQIDKAHRPTALMLKAAAVQTNAGRALAEVIGLGDQALKDGTVKADDAKQTGWKAEIANYVRGTLGNERDENDVMDAAFLVRAAMDSKGAKAPGFDGIGNNDAQSAVRLVIGMPMERAGVKTLLPREMTVSDFDDRLRALTPEKLKDIAPAGVYIRGQHRTLEQLSTALPGLGMKRDSQGRYIPVSSNALVTLDLEGQNPLRLEIR